VKQHIVLEDKKLYDDKGELQGVIRKQLTDVGMCDQHPDCPGPIVRFEWVDGRNRKECLYVFIKVKGWSLKE